MWYHEYIGGGSCLIVDIWWQIEIGGHMILLMLGVIIIKFGSVCYVIFGVFVELVDDVGNFVEWGGGYFIIICLWLLMLRGIWGDFEWYHDIYWSCFEGCYFVGDGVKVDDDGYLWLFGRVDDVMNVLGYRIFIVEVELVLVDYLVVVEAVVVGATDAIIG